MTESIYYPLSPTGSHIRLLEIQPAIKGQPLQCDLLVADLDEFPLYETLSYRWAEQTRLVELSVANSMIMIQQNVYEALTSVRLMYSSRRIWVDAVCIHQADLEEKAKQVRIMKRIYTQCTQCLIWLVEIRSSPSLPETDFDIVDVAAAFDLIRLLATHSQNDDRITESCLPASLRGEERCIGAAKALCNVMAARNAWWHRVWTIQEAVLPTLKTLIWQSLYLPWETCVQASTALIQGWITLDSGLFARELISALYDNLNFITPVASLQLAKAEALERPLNTFHRWRLRHATDPRDKLYGVLGLLTPGALKRSQCDYTITPAEVFTRLTLDLIDLEGSLLPLCGLRGEMHATPGLPSWVLDLVRPDKLVNEGVIYWEQADRYRYFSADGRNDPFTLVHNREASALILRGLCIGVIKVVDEGIAVDEKVDVPNQDFVDVLRRRELIVKALTTTESSTHELRNEAFWRASMGNVITVNERVSRRAEAADAAHFDRFIANGEWNEATETIRSMLVNQSFCITENGYLGIGPPNIQVRDECWVVYGSNVPLFLRPHPDGAGYILLGDGYVQGIMDGELTRDAAQSWECLTLY